MGIIFDVSKRSNTNANNFKKLCRRLRSFTKVKVNKDNISNERLKDCELLIISFPQSPFVDEELQIIKDYVNDGGSLAVFSSEGGSQGSNLNELTSDFGIGVESTTLVRAVYHKYLHPKHALVQNGIVQPEIGTEKHIPLNDTNRSQKLRENMIHETATDPSMSLSFVYPNGTTLSVQSPAYTLLSSGSTSYPVDCPISAVYETSNLSGEQGRVIVCGSSDIFSDAWLEKEENSQLCDVLFRFLLRQNVSFDPSLGRSDFEEKELVPDIATLSHLVKPSLQENDPLPQDYKSLLCDDLFGLSNDHVPDVIDTYKSLNVTYEPLTLVEAQFECPHPPLKMATHQPRMLDPPPPALELYDLDDCFSKDTQTRLAELTNQFTGDKNDTNLERYIKEARSILGIGSDVPPKQVLYDVCSQIFQFKLENEPPLQC